MSFGTYLEQKVLDAVLGQVALPAIATVYVGLSTTTISNSAGSTEPVGNAYARVAVTNNATQWPASTGNTPATKSNANAITFPQATGSWGTVTDFEIRDAASGGNVLGFGKLTTAQAIANGGTLSFPAGQLQATLL